MKSPIGFSLSGIFYILSWKALRVLLQHGITWRKIGYGEEPRNSWRGKANQLGGERYPLDVIIEGDTGITQQWEQQQDKEAVAAFNARVQAWGYQGGQCVAVFHQ